MTTTLRIWIATIALLTSSLTFAQNSIFEPGEKATGGPFSALQDTNLPSRETAMPATACRPLAVGEISSLELVEPSWSIPVREPGVIESFSDVRGAVLSFPLTVDADGRATSRRMVIDSIEYVETDDGQLAVSQISGEFDDGEVVDATDLATGRVISSPEDMAGVLVNVRALQDRGPLMIEDIRMETRDDGLLVIASYSLVDETGQVYSTEASGPCPSTLSHGCACPKFLGYCNDSTYPDCDEKCNFGNADCRAYVDIGCTKQICLIGGLHAGYCIPNAVTQKCECHVAPPDDEDDHRNVPTDL